MTLRIATIWEIEGSAHSHQGAYMLLNMHTTTTFLKTRYQYDCHRS